MLLAGKVIVVTGSGHGIGAGLAKRFVAEGAQAVVVSDIDPAAAQHVAGDLGQPWRASDVGDMDSLRSLIDFVERDVGPIDLFCNNPADFGHAEGGNLLTSDETWARSWSVNVMAHVHSAQILVPQMMRRGGGYFLQTLSAAALITANSPVAYSVTKYAGLGFAEWLALNYGDKGIGVSCLCPTAVERTAGEFDSMPEIGLVQTPADVADFAVRGIENETFLILPNPAVGGSFRKKANDYDGWLEHSINRLMDLRPACPFE